MKPIDLTQLLAAEAILRPYITDPTISIARLALQVVTAYQDAAPQKKKRPAPSTELALIDDPVMISLQTNQEGVFYPVLKSHFEKYTALYPGLDIAQELRSMCGWCDTHRENRKTIRGMPAFINGWLARNQNRSRPNGHGKPSNNDTWLAGAADLAAELRSNRG